MGWVHRLAPHLIRWERPYGWTRVGFGSVAEKEVTLATVLGRLLQLPDHWETFTAAYLDALDTEADRDTARSKREYRSRTALRDERADSLAGWHQFLIHRLQDDDALVVLERLATHPGLAGPERTFLEAELAHRRGDAAGARKLIGQCQARLPGHEGFREAARRFAQSA